MSVLGSVSAAALLATRAVDDSDVSPGVIGFIVVALLGVATWLLLRSMTRQIKKIDLPDDPASDDEPPAGPDPSDPRRDEQGSAEG